MSSEKVKSFLKRYKNDPAFKQAIDNAPDNNAKRRIAKEAGYEFTAEDVARFSKLLKLELEDADLDNVVGGSNATLFLLEDIEAAFESAF